MATKELKIVEPRSLAEELYTIQEQKALLTEREDEIKDRLLEVLQKTSVGFIRLDNGTTFTRSHRETLKAKDEAKARAWAEEHNCLKIDTGRAMKILRRELKMPRFFERVIGADYLTIKRAGQKDDEE